MADTKTRKGGILFSNEDGGFSGKFTYENTEYDLLSNGEEFRSDKENAVGKPYKKIVMTNPANSSDVINAIMFHRDTDKEDGKIGIAIIFKKPGGEDQETIGYYTTTKPKDYKNPKGERVSVNPYYRLLEAKKREEWNKNSRDEENKNPF